LLCSATRRPTPAIAHIVTAAANKPAVKAASTTSGTHNTDAATATSHTPPTNAHPRDGGATGTVGKSTTSNKAQAHNIQLSSKGTTPVDGLLAKGFNHGNTKQSNSKALRTGTAYFSIIDMAEFSLSHADVMQAMTVRHLQSLGANLESRASVATVVSANLAAPLAKHFHWITPLIKTPVALGAGKAETVSPDFV
jgi:hypothetical protein